VSFDSATILTVVKTVFRATLGMKMRKEAGKYMLPMLPRELTL